MDVPLPLGIDDLRLVVSLLGRLATSADPVRLRKRQFADGLARQIAADAWLWTHCRGRPPTPTTATPDGGRCDDLRQHLLRRAVADPRWSDLCRPLFAPPVNPSASGAAAAPTRAHATRTRRQLLADDAWYASTYYTARHAPTGLDDFVITAYPLDADTDDAWSVLTFWRSRGVAPFSDRDRDVLHLLAREIDGLHRLAPDPAAAHEADDRTHLSPRQHQVLQMLLAGNGNKQVALKLKISQHTVSDYVKALHARFKVNSRGELLSRFVAGANAR